MTRTAFMTSLLVAAGSTAAWAGTFEPAPILEDPGLDVLNRKVARETVDRDLFSGPWATVVVGSVDVYDAFPYLEARTFQVVSDPRWNRLLTGEVGGELRQFDGRGTSLGALAEPRGLAVDAAGRVFVADCGNHRVVVLESHREYGSMTLTPAFSIEGLSRPYDVAHSDRGTPFDLSDDMLYVADTGANRVAAFEIRGNEAHFVAATGSLGSGANRFAGPTAIAVGRRDGASTSDVYVADAHSARIVHLVDQGGSLAWVGDVALEGGVATSLDVDHRGNVYAALPQAGRVEKLTADLRPLASTGTLLERPRSFHVPFLVRTDHRDGSRAWVGESAGLVVEEWNDRSGLRLMKLGVEIKDLAATGDHDIVASFTLTDHAEVSIDVRQASTGAVVARRTLQAEPGPQTVRFESSDPQAPLGDDAYQLTFRSRAVGSGDEDESQLLVQLVGSFGTPPQRAMIVGHAPNPFAQSSTLSFAVPAGAPQNVDVAVYDVSGRLVRTLERGVLGAGVHRRTWDGRDSSGRAVSAGVYLYRYEVAGTTMTEKTVRIR